MSRAQSHQTACPAPESRTCKTDTHQLLPAQVSPAYSTDLRQQRPSVRSPGCPSQCWPCSYTAARSGQEITRTFSAEHTAAQAVLLMQLPAHTAKLHCLLLLAGDGVIGAQLHTPHARDQRLPGHPARQGPHEFAFSTAACKDAGAHRPARKKQIRMAAFHVIGQLTWEQSALAVHYGFALWGSAMGREEAGTLRQCRCACSASAWPAAAGSTSEASARPSSALTFGGGRREVRADRAKQGAEASAGTAAKVGRE